MFLMLAMASPAWAAVTLHGIVSLDRERGAPVAKVAVSAPGANATISDDNGAFVMIFPEGRPGQDVRLGVRRAGWSVVNDILLDHRLPGAPAVRPFEIIVCKETERDLRVAEFYRLKGNQAVEQTYKIKLAELEGRQAATAQERNRLLRERDQARQQVDEWAPQIARLKTGEIGGSYREALRLFLDGKTDAALQILSEERLEQEALKAQEQLNQAVQGWLLKGQLLITRLDFAGAGGAYAQAIKFAPSSYDAWFQYGYFHQQQNHFTEALRGYERALQLAPDTVQIATTLNNLGVLHSDENRMTEARKVYEKALDIHRDLAKKNPDVYLPYVATTLNNLGVLHRDENRMTEARKVYDEALDIRRDLAKKNPDVYLPDVAMTLNNLGNLHSDARVGPAAARVGPASARVCPASARVAAARVAPATRPRVACASGVVARAAPERDRSEHAQAEERAIHECLRSRAAT